MAGEQQSLKSALIVIDVQNDFCDGGGLAAQSTSTLIDPLNRFADASTAAGLPVVFTRDWHSPDHASFLPQGGPWPPHCVRNTHGAAFHARLHVPAGAIVVDKGVARDDDGYSAFRGTRLAETLGALNVTDVIVCGIAAEYCVLASVKEARGLGFRTIVLEDLVRAIEARPGDSHRAFSDMKSVGAILTMSSQRLIGVAKH
jgi:nicotinamidase/pyrazinamidase